MRISAWPSLAILGLLLLSCAAGAQDAAKIRVTTALDNFGADGLCSLREAIVASNTNSNVDPSAMNCAGSAIDSISFSIGSGTPTITVGSPLPTITDPVTIAGNSGGATRVILQPSTPGLSTGLDVASTATNSTLRFLWVRNFTTGVYLGGAGSVLISSVVSENLSYGVNINAANVRVGGTSGTTPGGACTGDCNVIYGNNTGIRVQDGTNVVIQGNHIGAISDGTVAYGNVAGILVKDGTATVGGTTAAAGNLISGNSYGIEFAVQSGIAGGSFIQGNRIGTDTLGTSVLPNGEGIYVDLHNEAYPVTIGGSAPGAGNLISGNTGAGIRLGTADDVIIHGNRIGTQADGTSPLPNGGPGVDLDSSTHNNVIGGTGAGEANVIAGNATGVTVGINNYYNSIRGNSIYDNAGKGIELPDQQTNTAFTPAITGFSGGTVSGTACLLCTVDVYSDAGDEGKIYIGSALANLTTGHWSVSGVFPGPYLTATATTLSNSTSEFSAPVLADRDGDGIADMADNCIAVANASQCDSDGDGYGNHCDGDLNNNGFTNAFDTPLFRAQLGQPSLAPTYNAADLNCNGFVNAFDTPIFRSLLGSPPGPSGLHP